MLDAIDDLYAPHSLALSCMRSPINQAQAARVAQQLSKWVHSTYYRNNSKRSGRTQIVNPSLCHETLERLAPSLAAHHGCDLIEINPGICLWTRHLHDAVKPRRHILVEPERKAFDQYITPLIEEDPERFVHTETLANALESSQGLLSENAISHRIENPFATTNNSLLLTVNLTGLTEASRWSGSEASYFFNDFYTSFWGLRNNIHRYGLIRVLAWAPDTIKSVLVPRGVESRVRQSVHLEACSSITEIAGAGWSRALETGDRELRWPDLALEDAKAVRDAEAAAGVVTPEFRRDLPPWNPHWQLPPDPELLRAAPGASELPSLQEFLALDEQLKIEMPDWRKKALTQKRFTRSGMTAEQKRWRFLLGARHSEYNRYLKMDEYVRGQRSLEQLWRSKLVQGQGLIAAEELAKMVKEAASLKTSIHKTSRQFIDIAKKAVDDYRAYDSRPRALAWNERKFEPLTVRPDEFAPENPLSLIDLTPQPRFRELLPTEHQCMLFDYVVAKLCYHHLTQDVYGALTDLLQAGVDEFIESVSDLKDPLRGGWYDLTELRIRSLPPQMFFEIALAYDKWPFRPEFSKLMDELNAPNLYLNQMESRGKGQKR